MLNNIPSTTLRRLVALSERKEALVARVQDIEREMLRIQRETEAVSSDKPARPTIRRSGQSTRRRQARRGELKKKIISALRTAGQGGLTIGDLSKKIHVKRANLYVWFNGTGRKVRAIKKIAPATYRLSR